MFVGTDDWDRRPGDAVRENARDAVTSVKFTALFCRVNFPFHAEFEFTRSVVCLGDFAVLMTVV